MGSKAKNATIGCKHFQISSHNFEQEAKFTLVEKITKPATAEKF